MRKEKDVIECPKCEVEMEPKIIRNGKMLFAVECTNCGYDMKNEVLQAMQQSIYISTPEKTEDDYIKVLFF